MPRKRVVIAFVACSLMAAALADCGHPAIEDKAVGWWRDVGTTPAYKMHITRLSDGEYQVTYPRSFRVPFPAQLKGDHLDIWGENTSDVIYVVTYDSQNDRLKAVHLDGSAYTLRRTAP